LVATVPPEKVILWAHPHLLGLSPAQREVEWAKFRTTLGTAFPKPLPATLGEARFVYFTAGWEPHAVAPPRRPAPWFNPVRAALGRVLAVKTGVDGSPLGRWAARLGRVGAGLIALAILAAVLVIVLPDYVVTYLTAGKATRWDADAWDPSGSASLAYAALVGLELTLAWGRGALWRRVRMIGVVGCAGLALLIAVVVLNHEWGRAGTETRSTGINEFGIDLSTATETMVREVSYGAYMKLALAAAAVVLAGWQVVSRWRWNDAEAPRVLLTAADVDYPGPGDDTFADLIGATGPAVVWPRVAGFFVALAAMRLLPSLVVHQSFSGAALVWAALVTAAAVAAFRRLGGGVAPLAAATIVAIAWSVGRGMLGRSEDEWTEPPAMTFGFAFIETLALLAGLSWAVRRMGPRPYALFFGALWAPLAVWVVRRLVHDTFDNRGGQEIAPMLLGAILFAAAMEAAIRLVPAASIRPVSIE
jgi:hypothetical protein